MMITSKPRFYDALLLSNQSPHPTKSNPYQSIPLDHESKVAIHFYDQNIHVSYQQNKLQISATDHELTEEEVFNVINHFAFKQGNTVSFLGIPNPRKSKTRKRKQVRVLAEEKESGLDVDLALELEETPQ